MAKKIGENRVWYFYSTSIDSRRIYGTKWRFIHFDGTKEECETALETYKSKNEEYIFNADVKLGVARYGIKGFVLIDMVGVKS